VSLRRPHRRSERKKEKKGEEDHHDILAVRAFYAFAPSKKKKKKKGRFLTPNSTSRADEGGQKRAHRGGKGNGGPVDLSV